MHNICLRKFSVLFLLIFRLTSADIILKVVRKNHSSKTYAKHSFNYEWNLVVIWNPNFAYWYFDLKLTKREYAIRFFFSNFEFCQRLDNLFLFFFQACMLWSTMQEFAFAGNSNGRLGVKLKIKLTSTFWAHWESPRPFCNFSNLPTMVSIKVSQI